MPFKNTPIFYRQILIYPVRPLTAPKTLTEHQDKVFVRLTGLVFFFEMVDLVGVELLKNI